MFKRWRNRQKECAQCPARNDDQCGMSGSWNLSSYAPGDKGTILQVCGNPDFRRRMMEMGFIKGTEVKVIKYAPLSDPIEFVLKGYHLSLRREEAAEILMDAPIKAA